MIALIGMFSSLELKAAKQAALFDPTLVQLARRALTKIAILIIAIAIVESKSRPSAARLYSRASSSTSHVSLIRDLVYSALVSINMVTPSVLKSFIAFVTPNFNCAS
jgi:hypothetical protein